ncbi:MAG: LapA family protein [Herminiimonas sp.]|nr:LapA family protein [Herminiimonas sp.]
MKLIFRIIAVVIFIVFFGFALNNTQEAVLSFFGGYEIRKPLVILLLGFFAAGAVLGVLAMTPTLFRHRRDLTKHKKLVATLQQEQDAQMLARAQQPRPDGLGS